MKIIGAHLSIAKGIEKIQEQMELLECETCAIFLSNQKRFVNPTLSIETIEKFQKIVKNPELIVAHGSYVINLANPTTYEKNFNCFLEDLIRCQSLGIRYYNVHPGSDTTGLGKEKAAKLIADSINLAIEKTSNVVILIENMAGQGNCFGRTFEELILLINFVKDKSRIGVTLDTCHMFAGGYDIRTPESFEEIMKSFDKIVGSSYLKAMHVNDSMCDYNSRKDRHECIGKGKIGINAFKYIMESTYFDNIPLILETPKPELYKEEIALLKSFVKEQ